MKIVPLKVSRAVGQKTLLLKTNSPRLMFVAGLTGVGVGTFLACRATLRLHDTVDKIESDLETVRRDGNGFKREPAEYRRDAAKVYGRGTVDVVRLYAPAIIVGGTGIAALTGAHVTLTRRNAGLTAAYSAMAAAYEEYRERVRGELGEEREAEIYSAIGLSVDGKKTEGLSIDKFDPNKASPYARFFDEHSPEWQKNAELNKLFVQCQQNYANHKLHAQGHLFLNEVYDMLGIPRSAAGQVVGWCINDDPTRAADNYIDFNIFGPRNVDFVNGLERSVLLDFNVDGPILDQTLPKF